MRASSTLVILTLTPALVAGCGSAEGTASAGTDATTTPATTLPSARLTRQEPLDAAAIDAAAKKSGTLAQALAKLKGDGYGSFVAAGVTADDAGITVTWAVYATASGQERTALDRCEKEQCAAALVSLGNDGAPTFTDTAGASASGFTIGVPQLQKTLLGKDHAGGSKIGALEATVLPPVDLSKRRLIIASAFGPAFGVDLAAFSSAATASGAFTEVKTLHYVRAADLDAALSGATPLDVLVWVGATVLDSGVPIGMTTNRGVFGDETYPLERVRDQVSAKVAPFGGPGVILLLGGSSAVGTGTNDTTLFNTLVGKAFRTVVGLDQTADAAHVLGAGAAFLKQLLGGGSLAAALSDGNAVFAAGGAKAKLVTNREDPAKTTIPGRIDALFGDKSNPKGLRLNLNLYVVSKCFDAAGKPVVTPGETESFASAFADVDFQGPSFSGTKKGVGDSFDVTFTGLLGGTKVGDPIYLSAKGNLKSTIKNITVYGMGALVPPSEKDAKDFPNRRFFDGEAIASSYNDAAGNTCILVKPRLSSVTQQPSWFDLPK